MFAANFIFFFLTAKEKRYFLQKEDDFVSILELDSNK